MQEFLVLLIVIAAVLIVWKHMAPQFLRRLLNHASMQIAMKMGWHGVTEKLAKKNRRMATNPACTTCEGCRPKQSPGCEMFFRPEDIRRK